MSFQNIDMVERFQRKYLRQTLKLNKNTPNCMVYGESGCINVKYIVYRRMINFWVRINSCKESKLVNIMYRLMFRMFIENDHKFKWLSKVKEILDSCGYSNVFYDISLLNKQWIKSSIKQKIHDISVQSWLTEVNNNSVCTNYRLFKTKLCIGEFVLGNIDNKITLLKFRCRNFRIPVNLHRYNDNVSDKCNLCTLGEVGDEFHYVFKCKRFEDDRVQLLKNYFRRHVNALQFEELFNSKGKQLKNVISFIKIIIVNFK